LLVIGGTIGSALAMLILDIKPKKEVIYGNLLFDNTTTYPCFM
jgi:hypothetical protein